MIAFTIGLSLPSQDSGYVVVVPEVDCITCDDGAYEEGANTQREGDHH